LRPSESLPAVKRPGKVKSVFHHITS